MKPHIMPRSPCGCFMALITHGAPRFSEVSFQFLQGKMLLVFALVVFITSEMLAEFRVIVLAPVTIRGFNIFWHVHPEDDLPITPCRKCEGLPNRSH